MQIEKVFSDEHAYREGKMCFISFICFLFFCFFTGTIRPTLEVLSHHEASVTSVAQWLTHFGAGHSTLTSNWTVLALIKPKKSFACYTWKN